MLRIIYIYYIYLLIIYIYSLFYHFVNLTFICNNNNLYIRLSFHCTYDTDEEIRDFEIHLSVILNDVILMLLFPYIFKWFFDIYIYIYIYISIFRKTFMIKILSSKLAIMLEFLKTKIFFLKYIHQIGLNRFL